MRIVDFVYERPSSAESSAVERAFDDVAQTKPSGVPGGRASLVRESAEPYAHMREAMGVEHPFSNLDANLPTELQAAIDTVVRQGPAIVQWRERRQRVIADMAHELEPLNVALREGMRGHVRYINEQSGGLSLATLSLFIDALRWKDVNLVRDFVHGFRSVGDIPDSGVFAPGGKDYTADTVAVLSSNPKYVSQLVSQVVKRAKRYTLAAARDAAEIWHKTMDEVRKGLCIGPFSRAALDRTWGYGRWRPMPRFGIWQKGKLRCIDDGRTALHNAITRTRESLRCSRADFPLRIARALAIAFGPSHRFRLFSGTDDIASAYRLVPTAQPWYTCFCTDSPEGDAVFFVLPGHPFGLTSAVLNFNRIPRLAIFIARIVLAVLCENFYDDCLTAEPDFSAKSGQRALSFVMRRIICLAFSDEKHEPVDETVVYLGVVSDFTRLFTHGIMTLRIKPERQIHLLKSISGFLDTGVMSPGDAAELEGKLMFSILSQFGKIGRAALAAIRQRAHDDKGSTRLSPELRDTLIFLFDLIEIFPSFDVPAYPVRTSPVLIWTDAMFELCGRRIDAPQLGCVAAIGAVVWSPRLGTFFHSSLEIPPSLMVWLFKIKKQYIAQLEMMAVLSLYYSLPRDVLANELILHFVDNQGVIWNLVEATSTDPGCAGMAHSTALMQARLSCRVWYEYVASDANVADLPSRGDFTYISRLRLLHPFAPIRWFDSLIPSFS